jgi:flagellar basal-body rod modification protein FlgD
LQYQDPLEPVTDSAFVAQLAQFSSLEQLENLNSTMSAFQYYSLAGQYVVAEGVDEYGVSFAVDGVVDRVVYSGGVGYVQVAGQLVKASSVTQVFDKDLVTGGNNPLLEASRLIGASVRGYIADEDGVPVEVAGVVTGVSADGGVITARLDTGERLPIGNIVDINSLATELSEGLGTETEQGLQQPETADGGNLV